LSQYLGFPDKPDWHYPDKADLMKPGKKIEIVGHKYKNYSPESAAKF